MSWLCSGNRGIDRERERERETEIGPWKLDPFCGLLRRPTPQMTSVSPAVTFWAWNAAMMAVAGLAEPAPQRKTEGCWHRWRCRPWRKERTSTIWRNMEKYGEIWRNMGKERWVDICYPYI